MANPLQLVVVTPEATVLDAAVDYVSIPAVDGELGVMANHAPLMARLACGELRLHREGKTERYYVDGGFAQVADNVVSVLTNQTLAAAEIDAEQARARLAEAESQKGSSGVDESQRLRTIEQARAQLRMAAKKDH
jgi:F-type H+-transporting ATPase subunit epsilon